MGINNKKSFILYVDSFDGFNELNDQQHRQIFEAIIQYQKTQTTKLTGMMLTLFTPFKNQFDRNIESYNKKCESNKVNGGKGGRPKNPNNPSGFKKTQNNPVGLKATQDNPVDLKITQNKHDRDIDSDNKKIKKINKKSYPNQCREFIFDEKHKIAIRKKYPDITQTQADNILLEFRHQAENRAKPFKNISSGFLSYLRRGYLDELVLNNRAPKGSVDELEQQEQEYPRILIQKIREKQPDISDKEIERIVEIKKNAYQTQNFVELNNIMKTIGVSYVE